MRTPARTISVRRLLTVAAALLALGLMASPSFAKGKPAPPPDAPDGMCTGVVLDLASDQPVHLTAPCIDVTHDSATPWAFDVAITGKGRNRVGYLYLNIRERDPGDFCWVFSGDPRQLGSDDGRAVTFTIRTDLHGTPAGSAIGGVIPASRPEACADPGAFEDSTDSMVATLGWNGPKNARVDVVVRP